MEIIDWILVTITGISGFFLGMRKTQKETDSISIQNVASTLNVYQDIIADLKDEINSLKTKMDEMEKTITNLKKENKQLRAMIEKHGI
jgi:peptidoglycan hydrolase CwlO-like protein